MKGDFTRFSHQPEENYVGVLMQQGRVTIDADWNEQFEIDDHRWRSQTIDTIGRACAPEDNAAFGLTLTPDGTDVIISPGRIYVDGILVEVNEGSPVRVLGVEGAQLLVSDITPDGRELAPDQWIEINSPGTAAAGPSTTVARIVGVEPHELGPGHPDAPAWAIEVDADLDAHQDQEIVRLRRIVTYLTQPYFPADADPPFGESFDPAGFGGQTMLMYLDVWRRHVTAIEDPDIREVALRGPDTATRVQTVWALRILRDPDREGEPLDASQMSCSDDHPVWDALTAPAAGRLSARAEAAPDEDDPCAVQPTAGYRGLENLLYRVEVHEPGALGTATFKWSRHNGSILSSITDFPEADEVQVHSLGKDKVLRFDANHRVEALSEFSELAGLPGTMASIVGAPDEADRRIVLDQDVSVYDGHPLPRLRRWDHGAVEPATSNAWFLLERGVQVRFGAGPFRTGDYWVIPARVETGDVEGFIDAPPRGITHHYARIAIVTWPTPNGGGNFLDCRHTFPPLCEIEPGEGDHCCTVSVGPDGDFLTLQEAVDSLDDVEGPARICILPGEHRFAGPAMIGRSQLTITGCGQRSHLVATSGGAMFFDDANEIRIEDLWISSQSDEATIHAHHSSFFELIDCHIVNRGERQSPERDGRNTYTNLRPPQRGVRSPVEELAFDEVRRPVEVAELAPGIKNIVGPGLHIERGRIVTVRDNFFQANPAASLSGVLLRFENNLVANGGVHVRDGSEFVSIQNNTIAQGPAQGVLLGGLADDEPVHELRAGMRSIVIAENLIEGTGREGISTHIEFRSEIDSLTIAGNRILECGSTPLTPQVAIGGGVLVTDASDVAIRDNIVRGNGPRGSGRSVTYGFGVAALLTTGLAVHGNRIEDNGSVAGESGFNIGLLGFGLQGSEQDEPTGPPAAAVHGNTVVSEGGPAIALLGIGAINVNDNVVSATYPRPSQLDFGRAVLIYNLGASTETGLANYANVAMQWPLRHGPIMFNDNQVSLQADPFGLNPVTDNFNAEAAEPFELAIGSTVALFTLDDASLAGNQIRSEVPLASATFARVMRAAVWTAGATVRATDNRIAERLRTAALSYYGFGFGHVVTENITTHCIRADGTQVIERDNVEINCERRRNPDLPPIGTFRRWEG